MGTGGFCVNRTIMCHGTRECAGYGRRKASERMNSRAERIVGRNPLRGLNKVGGSVGMALTLMFLIVIASHRWSRPELARSIECYASHLDLD